METKKKRTRRQYRSDRKGFGSKKRTTIRWWARQYSQAEIALKDSTGGFLHAHKTQTVL